MSEKAEKQTKTEKSASPQTQNDLPAPSPHTIIQLQSLIGNKAVQRLLLQRDFIQDAAGTNIAYEFRIGTELERPFVDEARRVAADGAVGDADLRRLRTKALMERGTVDDHERMFMAGLLDPANVATFNAARGDFQFPTSSITSARLSHVIDLDRELPQAVRDAYQDLQDAFDRGDAIDVLNQMTEIEIISAREIVADAGSFQIQANTLLNFITTNNISASVTLNAMINAASDNSRGDRILAGIVYAITAQAGDPLAGNIAAGTIKVDALVPAALAQLPGFSGGEEAAYVTVAQGGGTKGDTMYVKTELDPTNTYHRSVVIHEMQHAADDAASPAAGNVTFPQRNQLEANAYRRQARYIYSQLEPAAPAERTTQAQEIVGGMNQAVVVALVLEGKADTARYRPLFEVINNEVPPAQQLSGADINTIFSRTEAQIERVLLNTINVMYGLTDADPGVTDGLAGESIMDWIDRV